MKTNGHGSTSTSTSEVAIERVADMAHGAVDKAADAVAPAADWLQERGDDLIAKKEKLLANTCSYVSTNPLKAVGIAVVAGFLLSRIVH